MKILKSLLNGNKEFNTFMYKYNWARFTWLYNAPIVKLAAFVPVLGYAILFNDYVVENLSFEKLTSDNLQVGLDSKSRLRFLYFGLIFLAAAQAIYYMRRPFVMQLGTNEFDYVERAFSYFTLQEYTQIHHTIKDEGCVTLHGGYDEADWKRFSSEAAGSKQKGVNNWAQSKSAYESLLRSMLIDNFKRYIGTHQISLTLCILASLVGYALLFIPSFDLFIKVLMQTF